MANPTQQDYVKLMSDFECLQTRYTQLEHKLQQVTTDNGGMAQQIQVLLHQIQQLQNQSAQHATTSSSTSSSSPSRSSCEPKLSLPAKFDGTRAQFRGFLNQIRLVIRMHASRYPDDNSRVGLVGSLLTGTALAWFSPLLEQQSPLLLDFNKFIEEFKSCFSDTDSARTALNKLRHLQQGNRAASTYAAEFRLIACDVPWDQQALIDQFRHGLRGDVKDLLLTINDEPTTLAEAIQRAVRCDNRLFERRSERQRTSNYSYSNSRPSTSSYSYATALSTPPPTQRYAAPPPLAADGPVPMEIDATRRGPRGPLSDTEKQRRRTHGLCLYCGEHGHFAMNCPHAPRRRQVNPVDLQQRPRFQDFPQRPRFQAPRRPQVNHIAVPTTHDHVDVQVPSPRAMSRSNSFEVLSQLNEEVN